MRKIQRMLGSMPPPSAPTSFHHGSDSDHEPDSERSVLTSNPPPSFYDFPLNLNGTHASLYHNNTSVATRKIGTAHSAEWVDRVRSPPLLAHQRNRVGSMDSLLARHHNDGNGQQPEEDEEDENEEDDESGARPLLVPRLVFPVEEASTVARGGSGGSGFKSLWNVLTSPRKAATASPSGSSRKARNRRSNDKKNDEKAKKRGKKKNSAKMKKTTTTRRNDKKKEKNREGCEKSATMEDGRAAAQSKSQRTRRFVGRTKSYEAAPLPSPTSSPGYRSMDSSSSSSSSSLFSLPASSYSAPSSLSGSAGSVSAYSISDFEHAGPVHGNPVLQRLRDKRDMEAGVSKIVEYLALIMENRFPMLVYAKGGAGDGDDVDTGSEREETGDAGSDDTERAYVMRRDRRRGRVPVVRLRAREVRALFHVDAESSVAASRDADHGFAVHVDVLDMKTEAVNMLMDVGQRRSLFINRISAASSLPPFVEEVRGPATYLSVIDHKTGGRSFDIGDYEHVGPPRSPTAGGGGNLRRVYLVVSLGEPYVVTYTMGTRTNVAIE